MYRYIVYRNNWMYLLEQHDKYIYNFKSVSQIIELTLQLKEKFVTIFTLFKYGNVSLHHDIFGAMH